jgi:hydroxymethylglutaryl-CoA lyase
VKGDGKHEQEERNVATLPQHIEIVEEGPREGFQIEKGPITTARKIELIDALSQTGVATMQIVSFVNPKLVPGMADAEAVVAGMTPVEGVSYRGLWLNEQGFDRANASDRLDLRGSINLSGSDAFLKRNQNRTPGEQLAAQHHMAKRYKGLGIPIEKGGIFAAFGCNFQGDVPIPHLVGLVGQLIDIANEQGIELSYVMLADTMAWATPASIKRTLDAIWQKHPGVEISLHLHDTRGMGIANVFAGLEMGVKHYDSAVAGLGGCPFAGHAGAAGNVCTEDIVFMCDEMGITTGIDLERLIECAALAEDIVGHPLPGAVMRGGSLAKLRAKSSARLAAAKAARA